MQILYTENCRDSIAILQNTPDIEVVLMNVMMSAMDGYSTIHPIRLSDQFKRLPIIVLTAKAIQGDREKSIEAGASNYITKPIDSESLSMLF